MVVAADKKQVMYKNNDLWARGLTGLRSSARETVDLRFTATSVEVFKDRERIASHPRSPLKCWASR
jgi:hypothetical protein